MKRPSASTTALIWRRILGQRALQTNAPSGGQVCSLWPSSWPAYMHHDGADATAHPNHSRTCSRPRTCVRSSSRSLHHAFQPHARSLVEPKRRASSLAASPADGDTSEAALPHLLDSRNRIGNGNKSGVGDDQQTHSHAVPQHLLQSTLHHKELWLKDALDSNPEIVTVSALHHVLEALRDAANTTPDTAVPYRAETWLSRSIAVGMLPTSHCYQLVIEAWCCCSNASAATVIDRAEHWLTECTRNAVAASERRHDVNDASCITERNSNSNNINGDCNNINGSSDSSNNSFDSTINPTIALYNAYLDACTRRRNAGGGQDRQKRMLQYAQKADAVLMQLITAHREGNDVNAAVPTTQTFNFVIRGWARCKRDRSSAERVQKLVALMEALHNQDRANSPAGPNTKTYAMAMDALVNVAKQKAQQSHEANSGFINDSSINGIDEMRQARAILDRLHESQQDGNTEAAPNTVTYNILLTGWSALSFSQHKDAPLEAEKLLQTMVDMKRAVDTCNIAPNRISYEKVISAWINAASEDSGERATYWLKELWELSELESDRTYLPSNRTYNTILKTLLLLDGPEAAEDLLFLIYERFYHEKDPSLCPNSESFSLVIQAWVDRAERHSDLEVRLAALERASEWLKSVQQIEGERNVSTTSRSYLSILQAASRATTRSENDLRANVIALETLQDFKRTRFDLDPQAYVLALKVTMQALGRAPRGQKDVWLASLMDLLHDCCNEGLMCAAAVRTFANVHWSKDGAWTRAERDQVVKRFFSEWPLPSSWTRKLKFTQFLPRKEDLQRNWGKK